MNSLIPAVRSTAKAVTALIVCAAAYLFGIVSGDTRLQDLTQGQWIGLILFMGSAYGITYAIPNRPGAPVQVTGTVTSQATGETANIDATLKPDRDEAGAVSRDAARDLGLLAITVLAVTIAILAATGQIGA